ncbi:MAG: DNA primase [Holosporaceae bacterium]|jgi:DNA primase|nr:DNA primase [Holosporaceae bacterium]
MNKEFIDFLKSKASILDVIAGKVRLRKSGKDWFGLCPFHKEKTGSFKVDVNQGYYYCFGCGAHGDIISFVKDFEKISFLDAVEYLSNIYGIPLPEKSTELIDPNKFVYAAMDEIKNWFGKQLNEPSGEMARKYLESRKISRESIEKFNIGYAPDNNNLAVYLHKKGFSNDVLLKTGVYSKSMYGNELINRYNSRLIFPILDVMGRCIGFGGRIFEKSNSAKYINSPETEIFIKSNQLYGYNLAKRGKTRKIILTEGYLDVISMHQAGFDGTVAPLGTSISDTQINMCWRVCDNPIVSLDGDSAGIKASYRWIDKIFAALKPGKSFSFAKLPEGTDPDSLLWNSRSDVVQTSIENAFPLSEWVWEGAFLLYPSETPEQKAAIIKMLKEKIEIISDSSIKKLYIGVIREKEQNLYRKKFVKNNKKNYIQPIISVYEKIEKILVVTVINHPYIMSNIVENFVKIKFDSFQMQKLKEQIFDLYNKYIKTHDSEEYLMAIDEMKSEVNMDEVVLHASFSSADATDEDAINGWLKLWEKYSIERASTSDLQNVSSDLKFIFSEKNWNRLKALKKDAILDRIKGRGI